MDSIMIKEKTNSHVYLLSLLLSASSSATERMLTMVEYFGVAVLILIVAVVLIALWKTSR